MYNDYQACKSGWLLYSYYTYTPVQLSFIYQRVVKIKGNNQPLPR